jgi:hypothetical protein
MKNRVEKVTEMGPSYSTLHVERKHAYLIENKEKRMRLLDTTLRTRAHQKRTGFEGVIRNGIEAYERAASSCSKA